MEYVVTLEQRPEQPAAVVRGRLTVEGIPGFIGGAFAEVLAAIGAQHVTPAGPPFGRYRIVEGGFDVEAGFPTSGPVTAAGRVEPAVLPGGTVATTMHVGSYDGVAAAYQAVTDWVEAAGYAITGDPWESYLDGPEVAEPRTTICFPCRGA